MAWYRNGSVSVVKGSTSVTGIETRWASNARVGDAFRGPDGEWYEIVNIASETTMGILPAYQGTSVSSNTNYTIAPMQGYVKESADRLRQITNGIEDVSGNVEKAAASASAAASSATAAKTSQTAAAASATAAKSSETIVVTNATNAKTSETNAKTSETNAASSASAANTSKTQAATSATNAASSATAAANSASQAATSTTNAGAAAGAASSSSVSASNSASAAKTSETNAKTSETNAKTSETNAANSYSAARTSENNAAGSASSANTSRSQAATSATNASASETKAKAWATNPENTAVETGLYSALHWANKAKSYADAAEGTNGPRLTSIAKATMQFNDMLVADSTTTMTRFATGTAGRSVLSSETTDTARTRLGLKAGAILDATTSTYGDAIPGYGGLLMRVGAFGLGSTDLVDLPNGTDLNTVNATGFYQVNGGANTNSPLNLAGQMLVMTNATNHITQILSPQDKTSRLFTRSSVKTSSTDNTPDFGPWSQIMMAGDYGLGSTGYLAYMTGSVDDFTRANGTYSVSSSNPGTKPAGQNFGILEVLGRNNIEGSGSRIVQIWHVTDGQALSQMWIRHVSTSTPFAWTEWREMAGLDSITAALANVGLGLNQAANAIPASADLNTYMTTGLYGQSQNAQAANGSNYPVAKAGSLLVQNGGSAITTQQYMEYDTGNMWTRSRYNSSWTAWKFQVTSEYFDNFKSTYGFGTSIVSRVDNANIITDSGEYFVLSTCANIPVASNGTLKHESWSGTSAAKQTYTQLATTACRTWIRAKASGSWSPWFEVQTDAIAQKVDDLNNLKGTLSFGHGDAAVGAPDLGGAYDAIGWQVEASGQRTQFTCAGGNQLWIRTDDSANYAGFDTWTCITPQRYGVGETGTPPTLSNVDDVTTPNGFYRTANPASGALPNGTTRYGSLMVMRYSSDLPVQVYMPNGDAPQAGGGGMYIRAYNRNTKLWLDWRKLADDVDLSSKANLASPLFTGTPAAPTPSLNDNGDRLATTKFVQQSKRNYTGNVIGVGSSTTLTPAQSGYTFNVTASGITITLPAGADAGSGATYNFRNVSNGPISITVPTGGIFVTNSSVSTLTLLQGEWCEIAASTTNYFLNGRGVFNPTASTIAPTIAGTVKVTGTDLMRYVNNDNTYGLISRMDSGAFYMLLTDSGSPDASFNSLRPFILNLTTGLVSMNQGATTLAPSASDRSSRMVTSSWVGSQFAPIANPTFTGSVDVPTLPASDNSTKVANTAHVTAVAATKENNIPSGSTAQFWRGDKTWQDFGTMTRGQSLTGLSTSNNVVGAADSILGGIGKLQGQINAIVGDNTNITSIRAVKYFDPMITAVATGNYSLNLQLATTFELTLTGNTVLSFGNVPAIPANSLMTVMVTIKQGSTPRSLTLPANTTFITAGGVSIPTPTANKQQDYIFTTKNGTNWEVRSGAFT